MIAVVIIVIASVWLTSARETSWEIIDNQSSADKCSTCGMENCTMNHTSNSTATNQSMSNKTCCN